MHVILIVAAHAARRGLSYPPRCMARSTHQVTMRPTERISGLGLVVELPQLPRHGGVAPCTVGTQRALVHIVAAVAVDAGNPTHRGELQAVVALLARGNSMPAQQGERREIMMKAHVVVPA